jgi:hypothetical protein
MLKIIFYDFSAYYFCALTVKSLLNKELIKILNMVVREF